MNKIKIISLIFLAAMSGACYQKPSSSGGGSKPALTAATASPVIEKTVEPNNQPVKTGDYDAALNFYNSKKYENAAAEFEEVIKNGAVNQRAHFYLGKSFQNLNKPAEAVGAFQKAVELKPDDAEANYELGSVYVKQKDFEKSLPYIQKAAKIKYTNPVYLIALGDNYRELDRCNYAMPPYGNSTGFDDRNPAAYYGMGLCYIELKNRLAAAQQVSNLEKLDKNLAKKLADKIPK